MRRAELDNLTDRELISANAYAKNQLALEQAKRRLEQIAADSKTRIDTNRAALALVEEKRAKAELAATRAQQNIDSLVLRAPIDGLVVIRDNRDASGGFFFSGMTLPAYRAGDNTFAGRPIADVFDLSGMELRVQVGEQDRPNVTMGQEATVWPDALAASPLTAKVTAIAGLASSDFFDITGPVRQFDVTLTLDHPDPRLRPGTSVKVILAGRRVDNVLQVPLQAVRLKNGKPAVYVQTAAGFEAREVKVALSHREPGGPRRPGRECRGRPRRSGRRSLDRELARSRAGLGAVEMSDAAHRRAAGAPRHARRGLDLLPEMQQGFDNLRAHKLRSALTMLGMIFGVAAVIAMLSIGAGAQQQVIAFIEQLGVHNVIVEAREAGDQQTLQRIRKVSAGLSLQDLRSIQANVDGIVMSTARKRLLPTKLLPKPQGDVPTVYGVSPAYQQIAGLRLTRGRFFNEAEDRAAPVAVLGQAATAGLFGGADPIGQSVKVNQQWFRVIGIAGSQLTHRQTSPVCPRRTGTT